MKKTVLVFGVASGLVASTLMLLTMPFMHRLGYDVGAVVGYTGIVAAFLVVFFGVRSYREQQADGRLTFGRGFAVGILIVLISCAFYVGTWEIIYFKLAPNFMSDWTAHAVEQARASGASQAKIDETVRQMAEFKRIYDNPLTNAAVTFLEPFPIGLLVALISAGVLRRRPQAEVRPGGPVASAAVR
jgi:hypothetical protein